MDPAALLPENAFDPIVENRCGEAGLALPFIQTESLHFGNQARAEATQLFLEPLHPTPPGQEISNFFYYLHARTP